MARRKNNRRRIKLHLPELSEAEARADALSTNGKMAQSIKAGLANTSLEPASVLVCDSCGSQFPYAPRSVNRPCLACQPGIMRVSSAAGPDTQPSLTCRTCNHTWPLVSQLSAAVCPSCGGSPFIKGKLIDNGTTLVWTDGGDATDSSAVKCHDCGAVFTSGSFVWRMSFTDGHPRCQSCADKHHGYIASKPVVVKPRKPKPSPIVEFPEGRRIIVRDE